MKNLKGADSVEILVRSPERLAQVPFSQGQLSRIAEFIRTEQELEEGFDCGAFVHKVHNIPHKIGIFDIKRWEIKRLESEKDLLPTDTICISHDPTIEPGHLRITHFAIYLGDGLYLSKFGVGGRLIAATLEEMKRGLVGILSFP